jgi:hypothetical protein
VIYKPTWLIEGKAGAAVQDIGLDRLQDYEIKPTVTEEHYYDAIQEIHEGEFIEN